MSLLIANIEKVVVKDRVVSFILFMGKVAIVGIVGKHVACLCVCLCVCVCAYMLKSSAPIHYLCHSTGILAWLGFGDFLRSYGILLFDRPLHYSIIPILVRMWGNLLALLLKDSIANISEAKLYVCKQRLFILLYRF